MCCVDCSIIVVILNVCIAAVTSVPSKTRVEMYGFCYLTDVILNIQEMYMLFWWVCVLSCLPMPHRCVSGI